MFSFVMQGRDLITNQFPEFTIIYDYFRVTGLMSIECIGFGNTFSSTSPIA